MNDEWVAPESVKNPLLQTSFLARGAGREKELLLVTTTPGWKTNGFLRKRVDGVLAISRSG